MAKFYRLEKDRALATNWNNSSKPQIYWQKFKTIQNKLQTAAKITSISFCKADSKVFESKNRLSISSGFNVFLYDEADLSAPAKTISRFSLEVLCTALRDGGSLLAAAGRDNTIRFFDPDNKNLLRVLKGHDAAVNFVKFSSEDATRLTSFSDDKSVKHWDISLDKCVLDIPAAHTDFVRVGDQSRGDTAHWVSGGYDKTVKMWDFRLSPESNGVLAIPTAFSVESLKFHPGSHESLLLACGERAVAIYDIRMSGRLLHGFHNHLKLVTGLAFNTATGEMLSSSLDGSVKVYSLSTFEVTFQRRFERPLTAVAINQANDKLVAGAINGDVYFLGIKPDEMAVRRDENASASFSDVLVVRPQRVRKLAAYDFDLKAFRYKDALDRVILCKSSQVTLVAALFRELIERNVLRTALQGREPDSLNAIIKFLFRHMFRSEYSTIFINVAWVLIDIYEEVLEDWIETKNLITSLGKRLEEEIDLQKEFICMQGVLECLSR